MFCNKCGNELKPHVNFCPKCGNSCKVDNNNQTTQGISGNAYSEASATVEPTSNVLAEGQVPNVTVSNVSNKMQPANGAQNDVSTKVIIAGCIVGILILAVLVLGCVKILLVKNDSSESIANNSVSANQKNVSGNTADENVQSEDSEVEDTNYEMLSATSLEGGIQKQIVDMNANGMEYTLDTINVYEIKRNVGATNTNYTWDSTVFYALEGNRNADNYSNKDYCSLVKKQLINVETGNVIDYDVYMNPMTNIANKIVAIEYLDTGIEVTEYYYDNNTKPVFVFQYLTDNYVSTYATRDKEGERFLYFNDSLVTWRNIFATGRMRNFAIGEPEKQRLLGSGWEKVRSFEELNDKQKERFKEKELRMLNAAYNTYETVLKAKSFACIQGYVYDENQLAIKDAVVSVYSENFTQKIFATTTGADGCYKIYVPPDEYIYNLRISIKGRDTCDIYSVDINAERLGMYQDSVYLINKELSDGDVQLFVGDALRYNADGSGMLSIGGASIKVRKGINNRYGEIISETKSGADGRVVITLPVGMYTVEVFANGYAPLYYNVVANSVAESNLYELYAMPEMQNGEYAIVLTWGERPADLDAHMFATSGGASSHIWYGVMNDEKGNYLDVDDTSSYGPETMTIRNFLPTDYYKFCVVDFSNCSGGNYSSYEMSNSAATINVYSQSGLVGTFHVPAGTPGVIWEAFEIRNGRITPIQRYYNNVDNNTWWNSDK